MTARWKYHFEMLNTIIRHLKDKWDRMEKKDCAIKLGVYWQAEVFTEICGRWMKVIRADVNLRWTRDRMECIKRFGAM